MNQIGTAHETGSDGRAPWRQHEIGAIRSGERRSICSPIRPTHCKTLVRKSRKRAPVRQLAQSCPRKILEGAANDDTNNECSLRNNGTAPCAMQTVVERSTRVVRQVSTTARTPPAQ